MKSSREIPEKAPPWWKRKKREKSAAVIEKLNIPSGIWQKCTACHAVLDADALVRHLRVCYKCGHHFALPTAERMASMVDEGSFREMDKRLRSLDPLGFHDSKAYEERLRSAEKTAQVNEAFLSGLATIDGQGVAIGFFAFEFMGGSMGSVVGEKVTRLFERARRRRLPAVIFSSSGGARMQEGMLSLVQMAKTSAARARLQEAHLPFISVLTHPTSGGVAASFASLGDVIIAEPQAFVGFAGPRVIEQTIRQKLPRGFQRAEFVFDHGMIDEIVDRRELRSYLGHILQLLVPAVAHKPKRARRRQRT